jgi:hypothetical protein
MTGDPTKTRANILPVYCFAYLKMTLKFLRNVGRYPN